MNVTCRSLERYLEATWKPLGGHLEPKLAQESSRVSRGFKLVQVALERLQVGPKSDQVRPKSAQVRPKKRPREAKNGRASGRESE